MLHRRYELGALQVDPSWRQHTLSLQYAQHTEKTNSLVQSLFFLFVAALSPSWQRNSLCFVECGDDGCGLCSEPYKSGPFDKTLR